MKESETVHPKHFKEDAHIIYENHLKSWVENPKCLNNAELSIKIDEIIELQRQTQIQLTDVVRLKKADMQSNTPQTETSKDKPFYVG
jgi:precorrin-4 methylase